MLNGTLRKTGGRYHGLIRYGLRALGYEVEDTSKIGHGFPDLAVRFGGQLPVLLEIKDPSKPRSEQKLTVVKSQFFMPICYVVTTIEDVVAVIKCLRNKVFFNEMGLKFET